MVQIYRRYLTMIAAAASGSLLLVTLLLAPASLAWPLVSAVAVAAFASAAAALVIAVVLLRHISQAPSDGEQYAALLESANDIIYTHDLAGNILTANPAVERLLGYSVAEILTMNIADVLPPEQLQLARSKMVQKVTGDTTTIYELEVRAKDGTCIPLEISSRILKRDGQPVGILGVARDVRQRVEALEALRKSDERFRQLADNIDRVVWLSDMKEGIVYVNPAYEKVWGRSAEELYANRDLWWQAIHEEDRDQVREACDIRMPQGLYDEEYRICRPDGTVRWIHDRAFPIHDDEGQLYRVAGIAADITERKDAEAALRQSEATNKMILAAFPDTLIRVGGDNKIIDARWKTEAWTQLTPEMIIGRSVDAAISMYDEAQRPALYAFRQQLDEAQSTGEARNSEFTFQSRLGPREFEARLLPAGDGEILIVLRDVTDEKRAKAALRETQKLESIGILAGGIAHDFNNLLTGILAQASLARARLDEEHPARVSLQKAVRAAERAADLTRQLLAYAGQGQFELKAIAVNRLIKENSGLFETVMPPTSVLELDLTPELPPVEMDEGQLQQVVMNLVINAAEAVPESGGRVTVRTSLHTVNGDDEISGLVSGDALAPGPYLCLLVADNGQGIESDALQRIFDPFYTTKAGGRGLGLSATLGIVRAAGGAVGVQSDPGAGTTFRIYLPPTFATEAVPPRYAPEPELPQGGILVIDDEEPVREAVHDILEAVGMRVWAAENGRQGLEVYQAHRDAIDLVLVDMQMPEMDGEETFWALHQFDPQVRVLLSSGYSAGEISQRFPDQGPVLFLQKPYDQRRLVDAVRAAMNRTIARV